MKHEINLLIINKLKFNINNLKLPTSYVDTH
jgi:hypothetical protein